MGGGVMSRLRGAVRASLGRRRKPVQATLEAKDLTGDRDFEWSYLSGRIGRYVAPGSTVLDFGCGSGFLSLAAASVGARVVAIDLEPQRFGTAYPGIEFRQVDLVELPAGETYDVIINCSTIEHVGLPGRYGAPDNPDGDMLAMQRLRQLLRPNGHMLMTVPVGRDAVYAPLHRVYGRYRLPTLLEGYVVVEEVCVRKQRENQWELCSMETAMEELGGATYYAIGAMVLERTDIPGSITDRHVNA
jgi:SAM-dependent methyltransferase